MNEGEKERDTQQCQHGQHFQVRQHREAMPQEIVIAHEEHESTAQKQAEQDSENYAPVKFSSDFTHAWSQPLPIPAYPFGKPSTRSPMMFL